MRQTSLLAEGQLEDMGQPMARQVKKITMRIR